LGQEAMERKGNRIDLTSLLMAFSPLFQVFSFEDLNVVGDNLGNVVERNFRLFYFCN
jgi:hypothetical protein